MDRQKVESKTLKQREHLLRTWQPKMGMFYDCSVTVSCLLGSLSS